MSRYWITRPCSYAQNGKAVVYTNVPNLPVELSKEVADQLGTAVRPVDENPQAVVEPIVELDPPKPRGRPKAADES